VIQIFDLSAKPYIPNSIIVRLLPGLCDTDI